MPRIKAASVAEHRTQTVKAIVDAFDELLAERDFDQVTFGDVAARPGIARNTIYNYAPDKPALVALSMEHSGESLMGQVNAIAVEEERGAFDRLDEIIDLLLHAFASGTRRIFLLQNAVAARPPGTESSAPYAELIATIETVLRSGIDRGEIRDSPALTLDVRRLNGIMQIAVSELLLGAQRVDLVVSRAKALIVASVAA